MAPFNNSTEFILGNRTDFGPNTLLKDSWDFYTEVAILIAIFVMGILGNLSVMKTTIKVETKFARQIMSMFFGLAITDLSICIFRAGILMYILFHPSWDNGSVTCLLWNISFAIVGMSIWENLLVVVQRLFIVKAFPVFRKYCTISLVVILVMGIGMSQSILYACSFIAFDLKTQFGTSKTSCVFNNNISVGTYFYRIIVLGVFSVIPLASAIICHFWIVHRIVKARVTKLQKIDDRDNFIKITKTALVRSFVLFFFFTPFLSASIIDPCHEIVSDAVFRYLDYLLCAHSAVSPFITLQDSDFGDAMPNRKTMNQRKGNKSVFNSSFRKIGISAITSENLKTIKSTD